MIYLIIFLVTFVKVFARAFQQQNVIGNKKFQIIPTSYAMAVMEYITIGIGAVAFIEGDWMSIIYLSFFGGSGAWIGCFAAIWFYDYLDKDKK